MGFLTSGEEVNRASVPRGQKQPILTRFQRSTHMRIFKTHLEFREKTFATLVYPSPVAISLLDPRLFPHVNVHLIFICPLICHETC